jgi:hypothetical protein
LVGRLRGLCQRRALRRPELGGDLARRKAAERLHHERFAILGWQSRHGRTQFAYLLRIRASQSAKPNSCGRMPSSQRSNSGWFMYKTGPLQVLFPAA